MGLRTCLFRWRGFPPLLKQEARWLVLEVLNRCDAMLTGLAVPNRFRMAQQRMTRN